MSVREQLVKSLSSILRLSKSTLQVLLADENGLSIAKVARGSDIIIDPMAINSVSAATYTLGEETWKDMDILPQRVAFTFFEKVCLITIRIEPTVLTIVHDYNAAWPINAEETGNLIHQLHLDINEMFNPSGPSQDEAALFASTIRNILYLFNMGNEIPFMNYLPEEGSSPEIHDQIAAILDTVQNPVFSRYGIVAQDGLMFDGRDTLPDGYASIASFSATTIVAFEKLVEESANLNAGPLLSYMCISGSDAENLYATLACPSGKKVFADETKNRQIVTNLAFIALFPLTYGMIPIFCETRNIVYAAMNLLGDEPATQGFLAAVDNLIKVKYE